MCIVTYHETKKLRITNQNDIHKQIEDILKSRFKSYDNRLIDIEGKPILNRITYIVFPIWDLDKLAKKFQDMI